MAWIYQKFNGQHIKKTLFAYLTLLSEHSFRKTKLHALPSGHTKKSTFFSSYII